MDIFCILPLAFLYKIILAKSKKPIRHNEDIRVIKATKLNQNLVLYHETGKIRKSDQSQNASRNYKSAK
jgi:hypothetical protein